MTLSEYQKWFVNRIPLYLWYELQLIKELNIKEVHKEW